MVVKLEDLGQEIVHGGEQGLRVRTLHPYLPFLLVLGIGSLPRVKEYHTAATPVPGSV